MPGSAPTSRLKAVVKRALGMVPEARGTRLVHAIERFRAFRQVALRPELTDRPDLLEELDREGIVVLPGHVPHAVATEWLRGVDEVMDRVRAGKLRKFAFPVRGWDFCRLAFADTLVPATRAFFSDPLATGLARAYLSPDVASYRHEIDYKGAAHEFVSSELPHFDNWRPTVKAFLYLTDVTEETAPFVYMPRTHKPGPWRRRYDRDFDVFVESGRYGHFFPQEIERLQREHGFTEKRCLGPAGTLIFADFRGVHRATPLRQGRRVLLNNCFGLMDAPVGDAPPLDD